MPYTKDHKSDTKERIIKCASELFCRYGFDKVSIGQIMALARMTHGAFYTHFESKEALFSAALVETLSNSRVARLVKGPFSIKHLTDLVGSALSLQEPKPSGSPGPQAILVNEIGSEHEEIRRLYDEAYERLKKILETRLTALSRLKRLPFPADKDTISNKARAILASLVGAVAIAKTLTREEEQQCILIAAQSHILQILGVNEDELGVVL